MNGILWAVLGGRGILNAKESVRENRKRVTLMESERGDLQKLVSTGKAAARKFVPARI